VRADLDTLVTALYVTVDDLFGPRVGPGRRPELSDAELVSLAVAQVLLGCAPSDAGCALPTAGSGICSLPAHPVGLQQALARRRPPGLFGPGISGPTDAVVVDQLRLLDSTALPCAASRETVKRSALWGLAGYGYCKSHHRWFWGLRLYLLATPDGMPVAWCLATPKLGEREVAQALLRPGMCILADKGFAGRDFEQAVADLGAGLVRPDRRDEPRRHGVVPRLRQWIESIFDSLKALPGAARRQNPSWRLGAGRPAATRPGRLRLVELGNRPA
jgi:hypothetical protein